MFVLDGEEEECDDEDEEQAPPAKLQGRRATAEGVDIKAWCQRGAADFCPPHTWCQSLPAHAPSLEAAFLPVLPISLPLYSCVECLSGVPHQPVNPFPCADLQWVRGTHVQRIDASRASHRVGVLPRKECGGLAPAAAVL